jgi:hypothetical protein
VGAASHVVILRVASPQAAFADTNFSLLIRRERGGGGGEGVGFVAQDVQEVIPEAVTQNNKGYLMVNNDPILWTMLNTIKEQQRQIAVLRTQLRRQAAKNTVMESRLAQIEHVHGSVAKPQLALSARKG